MKRLLACCVLCFGVACQSPGSSRGSDVQALVSKVEGSAEVLQHGNWQPLRAGQTLLEGDQARTGADGRLHLELRPYGGVMTLMPESTMQVEQLGTRGTNQQNVAVIRLTRGRVVGDTLKLPKGSKVAVKTGAGTFAIP